VNHNDPNVLLLEAVAAALDALRDRIVYVGGCVVGLMITDTARPPVRATQDVDLIVEIQGTVAYYQLEQQLKMAGLAPDRDIICRWRLGDLKVDVMPTDETILGFSNRWYPDAIRDAQTIALPSGRQIRLISPPLLLATKIEAFYDRGAGDFGASHDIEDIRQLDRWPARAQG
jgi:predicted nucleotidyltransferase